MSAEEKDKTGIVILIITACATLFIGIVFSIYIYHFNGEYSSSLNQWGLTGDFFGGVLNPLLSFFALLALLYTIKQNQKELSLTRKELSETKNIHQEQKGLSEKQVFESTYFNLLRDFVEYKDSIRFHVDNVDYFGQHALRKLINHYSAEKKLSEITHYGQTTNGFFEEISNNNHYRNFWNDIVQPLIKRFMNIMESINQGKIDDKQFYINSLKSSFGQAEQIILLLLYFQSPDNPDIERTHQYIEKLNIDNLIKEFTSIEDE